MISTAGIHDTQVRRVLDALIADNRRLRERLDRLQAREEGPMSLVLPETVKKAGDNGAKAVPSVDEIPDNIGGEGIDTLGAAKVEYTGGAQTVQDLKPAEAGANVTETRTAAAIASQGALATKNTVGTPEIDNNAVTNAKIGPNAVDTPELANDAVEQAQIAPGAVDTTEIADNAIENAKIANGAVDSAELATDAVTSAKVADNTIQNAHMTNNCVGNAEIQAGAVDSNELADGAVTNAKSAWRGGYQPGGTSESIGELYSAVREIQQEIDADYTINEPITAPTET